MLDSVTGQPRRSTPTNVIIAVTRLSPCSKELYIDCRRDLHHSWDVVNNTSPDDSPPHSLGLLDLTPINDTSARFAKKRKLVTSAEVRMDWKSLEDPVAEVPVMEVPVMEAPNAQGTQSPSTIRVATTPLPTFPSSQKIPRPRLPKSTAELLAMFCPIDQSRKSVKSDAQKANSQEFAHELRQKRKISYVNLDDSDDTVAAPSVASSAFPTPQAMRQRDAMDAQTDDVDLSSPANSQPLPERSTRTGHSLRPRSALQPSIKAENMIIRTMPKKSQRKPTKGRGRQSISNKVKSGAALTSRQAIRHTIATETAVKRAKFLMAKKEYFLPLLPKNNYITRLLHKEQVEIKPEDGGIKAEDGEAGLKASDESHVGTTGNKVDITPYVPITEQPEGVKAIMKPYQLSGLSFLVYLYKNGLSGILGDEMGLGKTLQTLSLVQYLKEQDAAVKSTTKETRPFLIVCPLSVLSSWMAETRRWTPNLKVLRFHGPMQERDRLKRIADGQEDYYGNKLGRPVKKAKVDESGPPVISLDSDPEDEKQSGRNFDVIVTTYETYLTEQSWFKRAFVWRYVVLDEGHKIKNDLSQISMALQGLQAEFRLILTGTPLQNNLIELWALLHWLYPEVFTENTSELFRTSFNLTLGRVSTKVMDDARHLLELIMLRRMKTSPSVNLNLPPKTEVLLFVPLTPMQRFWYTRLLTRTDKGLLEELFQGAKDKELKALEDEKSLVNEQSIVDVESEIVDPADGDGWAESRDILQKAIEQESHNTSKSSAWRKLMNLMMQLRKCCNHPYLLPNSEPDPYFHGDHIIRASGKFIVLEKLISEVVIKQGEKVLFFSGFTKMLDLCEELLNLKGGDGEAFKYVRLDGGTGRARRNLNIRLFNTMPDHKVMLISTRAGGLGINLATATKVVLLDQDWNPQVTLQAESRAHRLGQTKPVTIYKLCTQGTVEEQMMGRIQKKLYLSAKVTESIREIHTDPSTKGKRARVGAESNEDLPQLGTGELMSLVRRGAQALSREEIDINEMLNWDWETMLGQCKDKAADPGTTQEVQQDDEQREQQEKEWLSSMEKVESYVFNGKKYARDCKFNEQESLGEDVSRESRRIGKNTTVMIDGFAISKESMMCKDWEAVPTMAGKDPRLAEPKREKKRVVTSQDHCQVCWEGGEIICCTGCPRAYHFNCLDDDKKSKSKRGQFYCSQHECLDCGEKNVNVGGMIFRCRWCDRGYCEDCLEWDRTEYIGDTLPEYLLLDYPANTQSCYIVCPSCVDHHQEDPEARAFCERTSRQAEQELKKKWGEEDENPEKVIPRKERPSRSESMTDATTLEESEVTTPALGRYGVILDAGSSGTRVHVYRWLDSIKVRKGASKKELQSLPELKTQRMWIKKIKPGVSTFGDNPESVGPDHLEPLFKHALDIVPKHAVRDTPIFLLATAGMRLLPELQRKVLLSRICSYARSHTRFLLPDCDLHIQVISGETEGLYGWIAANYLLGGFDFPEDHAHGKGHHTYGFLDMGGASAQIAFAPNATEAEKHADDLKLLRMRTLDGASTEYKVFVTTWLGFGVNEARKRYVEALLEASATHDARELPDPCLPVGLSVTTKGDLVVPGSKEAQVHQPYLIGTGRFDECLRQTYPLLDKDAPCEDQPCLLHGVHVPAIDFDVNHFVGVSEYWHTTHEIFEMAHKDKSYDFNTYQKRVKQFCSEDWKSISGGISHKKWGKKVDEHTAVEVCFKASWLINVLHDGIGIPRVGLENTSTHGHNGTKEVIKSAKAKGYVDPFRAVDKIQDVEVSWTLGKMVLYAASQVPPDQDSMPVGFGSNVKGIPLDFQYAGSKHIFSNNSSSEYDDEGTWRETLFDSDSPRRIPGFILFLFIVMMAFFLWCGRERRTRLYRRIKSKFGGVGRHGSPKRRRPPFGGKLFGIGGNNSTGHYEQVHNLENGDVGRDFELNEADFSDNESSSSEGNNRVGRSSGWATPQLKISSSVGGGLDAALSTTSYLDHVGNGHGVGLGLGLGSPKVLRNAMNRSGLIGRTDSRDRLGLAAPTGAMGGVAGGGGGGGGGVTAGKRSRTHSPVRLAKSPLIADDYD
ncbi:MAG: hypothetical protein M1816_005760 [Peltula sp. TS41687]|nr:MAG: hypothetical protein M1816_005760 [Peltula sp. TS41687]